MIAIHKLWEDRQRLVARRTSIRAALTRLLAKPKAFEVIVGKPNTARAVKARHDLLTRSFARAAK